MENIFTGVKVLDVTKVFSGPLATRMLGDLGALVLKIEDRENGDESRNFPPIKNGWSGYYEILNRNKKSVSLNLKSPTELNALYKLAESADVFVENLTPSTKHKLKIDYETLKKCNPKIIYASLSGLGQNSDKKYYDVIAQAQSGLMSLTGYETPTKIGPAVVDAYSGMTLAFAISSALYYREKTGKGQYIDVSMLACTMNLLESNLIDYSINKVNPKRTGNIDNTISPFGAYRTKDGTVVVAAGNEKLWGRLAGFLKEQTDFDEKLFAENSLRLKNNPKLTVIIESVFGRYNSTDLEQILTRLNIPNCRVYEMSDVCADENNFTSKSLIRINHPKLGNCVIPGQSIKFSEVQETVIKNAPEKGDDNDELHI